ncbi:MAG: hypothetical protein LBF83_08015 [Spirochaetaceae bacterium]|jgi:hypothetical protein|nr:hypothetical protein [Spirochaetaceae bacterium]
MGKHRNRILITYAAFDEMYLNGKVMQIAGRENSGPDDLGTIVAPMPAEDVSIAASVPDMAVFSYTDTRGGKIRLRIVVVKIWSQGGEIPSHCTFTVYVPFTDGNWISRTEDVKLVAPGTTTEVVFNPHGIAETDDYLYIIDYETQKITRVNKYKLEGAGDSTNLEVKTYDLNDDLTIPDARGQAVIIMGGKLYALYISATLSATTFGPSQLLRLDIDEEGDIEVVAKTLVGKNAQSIIPVRNGAVVWLLVPAIGGEQFFTGRTNSTDSNICAVEAEAEEWPGVADIKITGDVYTMPPNPDDPLPEATAYNIIAVGAAMRNGQSWLYILTQIYNSGTNAFWQLYRTKVENFLALTGQTLTASGIPTVDCGIVDAPTTLVYNTPVVHSFYFWDLVYEQSLDENDDDEDRLWIALGSPLLVTKPNKYSSPCKPDGPFAVYYCIGGKNVNALDVTIETTHQASRKVSLKRGMFSTVKAVTPQKGG